MPIDYSKWDHLVDSDDDIPTPPIVTNKKPVLLKIKSAYQQIDLDKVLFAGVTSSLLEIPDVISAAITGIGYYVFLTTLRDFACWCPTHGRFHKMSILSRMHVPHDPLALISNFYSFMFGDGMGQEHYHGDDGFEDNELENTPEAGWVAFLKFRKWQIEYVKDFMARNMA